jgi:hypothetical protein
MMLGMAKRNCEVPAKRPSIRQVMWVIALAAVNLAVIRGAPLEIVVYPSIWVISGTIEFVIIWKLILKRSLRAFHYTCLIAFVLAFFVAANFVAIKRFHPLGFLVRCYQRLAGDHTIGISRGFLAIGEFWMACFLSLALASGLGLVAAWLERQKHWDIAAFFRGAFVGFGFFALLAVIGEAAWPGTQPTAVQLTGRLVTLGFCLIIGGLMGLSRMKSDEL